MVECPESIEELEELVAKIPMCRKEILKQVEARKEAGTAKSDREAARQLAEETGRSEEGIRTSVKRARKDLGSVNPPKPAPSSLKEITAQIKVGKVSDDDIKVMVDVIADAIDKETIPPNIANPIKRAADKHRKPIKRKGGGPSTLQEVHTKLNSAANDLLGYLDSGLVPEGSDKTFYQGIRTVAPMLTMCFVQMGVDIRAVLATVEGRKELEDGGEAIETEGAVVN